MNSADYAITFQPNWSVVMPVPKEEKATKVESTTASIIDDLVAQRESREAIPKTEVGLSGDVKPNPLFYEPELPESEYNGAGFDSVQAAGRKKSVAQSRYAKPKAAKPRFGSGAELDNLFNRTSTLSAGPTRRKKRSLF